MSGGIDPIENEYHKTDRAYVKAWRACAKVVAKALGAERAFAYDPGMLLIFRDGKTCDLSPLVMQTIYKLQLENEYLTRLLKQAMSDAPVGCVGECGEGKCK